MATVSSINGSNAYDLINNPLSRSMWTNNASNGMDLTLNTVASSLNTIKQLQSFNTIEGNSVLAQSLLNTEYSDMSLESLAAASGTLQNLNLQNLIRNNPGLAFMLLNPVSINSLESAGASLATIRGLQATGVTSDVFNVARDFTAFQNSGISLETAAAAYNAVQGGNSLELLLNSAVIAEAVTGRVTSNTTGISTVVSTGNSLESLAASINILKSIPGSGLIGDNQWIMQALFSNLTPPSRVGSIINTTA